MKAHINLLPQSYRRRRLIRQRLTAWSLLAATAIALGCGLFSFEYRRYASRRAQLASRESEYAPIQKMSVGLKELREKIDDLKQRENLALGLADEQPALSVIGIVSRAASHGDGEIYVRQFTLSRQQLLRGRRPEAAAETEQPRRLLTLHGFALNHPAVLSFVDRLRNEDVFDRVEIKSSEGTRTPLGAPAQSYLVECLF